MGPTILAPMNKRIASGVLWLFAGWYLGNLIAFQLGWSDLFGPILGIVAATAVAGDPLGLIWRRADRLAAAQQGDTAVPVD